MIDIHLSVPTTCKPNTSILINVLVEVYQGIDEALCEIGDRSHIGHRNVALARTHLEESLMHAIKALKLQNFD